MPQPSYAQRGLRRPHQGHEPDEQKFGQGKPVYPPNTDNLEWQTESHESMSLGARLMVVEQFEENMNMYSLTQHYTQP